MHTTIKAPRSVFVTGNNNKLREVKEILSAGGGSFEIEARADLDGAHTLMTILAYKSNSLLAVPELQGTTQEVAREKCRRAAEQAHPSSPLPSPTHLTDLAAQRALHHRRHCALLLRTQRPARRVHQALHGCARPRRLEHAPGGLGGQARVGALYVCVLSWAREGAGAV